MSPAALSDFARRLIALEGAGPGAAGRVCDRLRQPLARLAGVAGFRSLLSRAVALAKAEDGALHAVRVREDGTLEGMPGAGGAVVAHLLGLLVTFIGEPLTRQLVSEVWPGAGGPDGLAGGRA
jgi:hypothetical protein